MTILVSLSHAKTSKYSMKHFRIDVRHIDSKENFSRLELLQRMTHRSHLWVIQLARRTNNILSQVDSKRVMDITIGTPSLSFPAIVDTGSDLIWTQCKPCERCYKQSSAIFEPSTSSTYEMMPCTNNMCRALPVHGCGEDNKSCGYWYPYAYKAFTAGYLSSETFT